MLCFLILTFIFVGCGARKEESKYSFNQRSAILEKDDGWVYLYYCEFNKEKEDRIENPRYFFGGYNLKHKELDGYKMQILNEKTGKVELEAMASLPALLHNQKYVQELDQINALLNEKKFTSAITEKEMTLELKSFNKKEIVQLHNKAMEEGNLKEGHYFALPEADILQEDHTINGYRWQIGYLIMYGNIAKVEIELVYSDGTYLSDKAEKGTATEEEMAIHKESKSIEAKILEQQKFDQLSGQTVSSNSIDWTRLSKLLVKIEKQ